MRLATGAEMRVTGPADSGAVICVNGGGRPGGRGGSPGGSRRGFERALALGVEGDYAVIPGAVHGIAVRAHRGRALPLPRAHAWARLVAHELERFQAQA